jgi:hypothetical protein
VGACAKSEIKGRDVVGNVMASEQLKGLWGDCSLGSEGVAACHAVSLGGEHVPSSYFHQSEWSERGVTLHGVL